MRSSRHRCRDREHDRYLSCGGPRHLHLPRVPALLARAERLAAEPPRSCRRRSGMAFGRPTPPDDRSLKTDPRIGASTPSAPFGRLPTPSGRFPAGVILYPTRFSYDPTLAGERHFVRVPRSRALGLTRKKRGTRSPPSCDRAHCESCGRLATGVSARRSSTHIALADHLLDTERQSACRLSQRVSPWRPFSYAMSWTRPSSPPPRSLYRRGLRTPARSRRATLP